MKGVVFNLLENMVEENFGSDVWDELLDKTGQDGIYVATETYPDEQLVELVVAAHEKSGIPVNDLVRSFGEYVFPKFYENNPQFFDDSMSMREFLLSVDQVIHVEVRKLNPDAALPEFNYDASAESELTMIYNSPRKMCMLAEGLIHGAGKHFSAEYTLTHEQCMHDGADSCHLHLKFAA